MRDVKPDEQAQQVLPDEVVAMATCDGRPFSGHSGGIETIPKKLIACPAAAAFRVRKSGFEPSEARRQRRVADGASASRLGRPSPREC
jgi:hypothetical protein